MFLNGDIKGPFSRRLYGNKGDEVKRISDSGNVLIVEGLDGNRFSVLKQDVTTEAVDREVVNTIIKPQPGRKQKKAAQTQTLF